MPEYLSPGVYVEEVETGAMPIEGVGTSTAGFLGETERGPIQPEFVTSFAEFKRTFGGHISESYLAYAVEGFFRNGGARCYVGRIATTTEVATVALVGTDGEDDDVLTASAVGPGTWGERVALIVEDATFEGEGRFRLTIRYWSNLTVASGESSGDESVIDVQGTPDAEEIYDNLSPEETAENYYVRKINDASDLVRVEKNAPGRPENQRRLLKADSIPEREATAADYTGRTDPGDRTGLAAFEEIDDISIVCVPDQSTNSDLTEPVKNHCESTKDRFAVLQAARGADPSDLPPDDAASQKGYAAFYYPWIEVLDPVTNSGKLVPPGGHVAGIYARSDGERGVYKAPANEQVRGARALELAITKEDQDRLNPKGVNCIRSFRGRGVLVWGARTTSRNPLWKYVNVRRLFLYVEESIDEGTQWAVFEPNDERLWARVRQSISNFLTTTWRSGALMGTTPEEAFYVKCDRSTMTQDDIDNGRLIVEIGIAPVKPAEFVVIRITQWTSGAEA